MAKQSGNLVTHGLSGTLGGMLVFRQTATGTVVQSHPRTNNSNTEAQQAQRRKFQRAVVYANAMANDPEQLAAYAAKAKKGQTSRNVAVADFMNAPEIKVIDISGYHGEPGDMIRIEATDDFAVKEVKVVIARPDGNIVEEGFAKQGALSSEWIYTATISNQSLTGDRIEVYASDIPGNISKAEETVS